MKQLCFQQRSVLAIPMFSSAFVTVAAVLALLLAAPPVAIGQVATGSAAQAETSGGQTGAVPAAGTSEGAKAQEPRSPSSTSSTDAGTAEVSFQDGLLSVSAEGTDLVGLLGKVSKAAGVPIEIQEGVSGSVTIFFARLALEEGITRILDAAGSRNVLATFEAPTPGSAAGSTLRKVSVLAKAADTSSPRDPRRFDFATNLEALKRHIEARYGKEALREEHHFGRNKVFDTISSFSFYDRGVSSRVTESNARQYAQQMIVEFATFLSLDPDKVVFLGTHKGPLGFEVFYRQSIDSVPVENTLSAATIYKGEEMPRRDLVRLSQGFHPSIPISTTPTLTPEQAAQRGEEAHRKAFPVWNVLLNQKRYEEAEDYEKTPRHPPELVILPMGVPQRDPMRYDYYLAYKIGYPPQTYYIDAHSGKLIHTISHVQRSAETMRRVP